MCEIDLLDIVETICEGVLVRDPELMGRLRYRSFGETFAVLQEDCAREKESPQ